MKKNQNLLITGSATRVGRALALHFATKGWNIALHYFRSAAKAKSLKKTIEQKGRKAILIKADLKNFKQVEKIIPSAKKKLGRINFLINNAALFDKDDILNFKLKSWNDHLNINLLAPAILIKQFAKQIPKKNKSDIINIIDQRIFRLTPIFMSYTLSKSALYALTKTMAMRLGPNIKVNAIAPGPTIKSKRQSTKHFNEQAKGTILKKPVGLIDICDTVEFLMKNNSITGQTIAVDSGQNLNWDTKSGKE